MLFRHVDEKLMPSITLELSVYFKDLPSTMFSSLVPYLSSLHLMTTLYECLQLVPSKKIHF